MEINEKLLEELSSKIDKIKVVEDDEKFIGRVEDLRKFFIYTLAYGLLAEDDAENQASNIILTSDLLEQLEEYGDDDVLKIVYNPMGAYQISEDLNY